MSSVFPIPWWLVVICLLISIVGIADHDLWTPDEPREAAIALRMNRTGQWLLPNLAGQSFVEKPPLYYLMAAGLLRLAGPIMGSTVALRLTSVLLGLATLGMTYLLARRLFDRRFALLTLLILATMPGFIHLTHWLLIDTALMFFVAAALWAFAEAYLGGRLSMLILGGLLTAGAFLCKGFIGPLIILLGWLGLSIPWARYNGRGLAAKPACLGFHLLAFLLAVGPALAWMLALYRVGGPEVWREWFWVNQFGRFTGEAAHLGHNSGPWYYFLVLPVYLLPWIAAFMIGAARLVVQRGKISGSWGCLALWALGGLLLLSMPATKREIYLSVLLPAFAIISALALNEPSYFRWVQRSLQVWTIAIIALVALLAGWSVSWLWPDGAWFYAHKHQTGGWYAIIALLGLAGMLVIWYGDRWLKWDGDWLQRAIAVTALGYLTALTVLVPVIDGWKSYGPAFRSMATAVSQRGDARLAGWDFDETTRAGFYYYCDLVFPPVSDTVELKSILAGQHPRFNGILTLQKRFPRQFVGWPTMQIVREVRMGRNRVLQWIDGRRPQARLAGPGPANATASNEVKK